MSKQKTLIEPDTGIGKVKEHRTQTTHRHKNIQEIHALEKGKERSLGGSEKWEEKKGREKGEKRRNRRANSAAPASFRLLLAITSSNFNGQQHREKTYSQTHTHRTQTKTVKDRHKT